MAEPSPSTWSILGSGGASLRDRLTAALQALAVGDAMGRATEHYQPDEIIEVYDDVLRELVEPVRLADDEAWAQGEIGPPTARVLAALASLDAGDGEQTIPAIAAAFPFSLTPDAAGDDLTIARAVLSAAFEAAFNGLAAREALGAALRTATALGAEALAGDLTRAGGLAQASGGRRPGAALREAFPPDGPVGALIPFILALVYATQSARRALLDAVNEGGHAPETAGLAGALCAALLPASLPTSWVAEVEQVNDLDCAALAAETLARLGWSEPEEERDDAR